MKQIERLGRHQPIALAICGAACMRVQNEHAGG